MCYLGELPVVGDRAGEDGNRELGGIKEKVLAAKRAGISCVLLPELNQRDMEEIPAAVREGLRFEFLKTVDNALALALERDTSADFPSTEELAAGPVS